MRRGRITPVPSSRIFNDFSDSTKYIFQASSDFLRWQTHHHWKERACGFPFVYSASRFNSFCPRNRCRKLTSSLNRVYQVSNPLYRCFSRHLCSLGVGRVSSLENNTRWSSLTEYLRVCEFVGGCIGNLRDFGFRRRGFKPHVRWNTSTTWTSITEDIDSEE
jgi:hypothetical protein